MYYTNKDETYIFHKALKEQYCGLNHMSSFLKRRYLPESKIEEMLWIVKEKLKAIEKCDSEKGLNKHIKLKKLYRSGLHERMDY